MRHRKSTIFRVFDYDLELAVTNLDEFYELILLVSFNFCADDSGEGPKEVKIHERHEHAYDGNDGRPETSQNGQNIENPVIPVSELTLSEVVIDVYNDLCVFEWCFKSICFCWRLSICRYHEIFVNIRMPLVKDTVMYQIFCH